MNKVNKMLTDLWSFTTENSPAILTGLSFAGLISSGIMFFRAGIKAAPILEWRERELEYAPKNSEKRKQINKQTAKEIVPILWPPITLSLISGGCSIGANVIQNKRIGAIAAAYSISETALKQYQEKAIQLIGEKKERAIHDAICKDKVENNPPSESTPVLVTGDGDVLCYDIHSGRYFRSNAQKIGEAINQISFDIQTEMYVSLNDFYSLLGIPEIPMGDDMGWNIEDAIRGQLPISISAQLTPNKQPCLCIDYDVRLRADYRNLH